MKIVFCTECEKPIQSGYAKNTEVSALCETCYSKLEEELGITEEDYNYPPKEVY